MVTDYTKWVLRTLACTILGLGLNTAHAEMVQGIYLTQTTLEDTPYLNYLIEHAKAVGINTFVIDLEKSGQKARDNVALVKQNHLRYVARIIVFPNGGRPGQIEDPAYWAKRFELVKSAIAYGADEIQLDYIRYSSKEPASPEHAKNIDKVVRWFRANTPANIPLEADVFGIASFGESKHIGQNLAQMAESVNALCPMVYPSHYDPYLVHAVRPYQTIYSSLHAIQSIFQEKMPVKLYAFIEMSNYRYPLSGDKRSRYIASEIKAVKDAHADGWYAWSAHNQYDYLFRLLDAYQKQEPNNILAAVEATDLPKKMNEPTPDIEDQQPLRKADSTEDHNSEPTLSTPQATTTPSPISFNQPVGTSKIDAPTHLATSMNIAMSTEGLPWPLGSKYYIY